MEVATCSDDNCFKDSTTGGFIDLTSPLDINSLMAETISSTISITGILLLTIQTVYSVCVCVSQILTMCSKIRRMGQHVNDILQPFFAKVGKLKYLYLLNTDIVICTAIYCIR